MKLESNGHTHTSCTVDVIPLTRTGVSDWLPLHFPSANVSEQQDPKSRVKNDANLDTDT